MPPEEEILAAKLILEHREPWLRNEANAAAEYSGDKMSRANESTTVSSPAIGVAFNTQRMNSRRSSSRGSRIGMIQSTDQVQ